MGNRINLQTRRGFPILFKVERNEDRKRTVFGCYPDNNILKDDELVVPADNGTYIVESVKRRNVVGNYPDDVNKENAHFEAVCSYTTPPK